MMIATAEQYTTGVPEVFQGNLAAEQVYAELEGMAGDRLKQFREVVSVTPLIYAGEQVPGCAFYVKNEGAQPGGSYKIRGTTNKILAAQEGGEPIERVVVASTGNHAIETAIAASQLGIPFTETKCPAKILPAKEDKIRAHGMGVDARYTTLEAALTAGEEAGKEPGTLFIHPFDDESVIAAQGTIGLEAMAQLELQGIDDIDPHDPANEITLVVPGGGGGLAAGNVVAMAAYYPNVRVAVAQMKGGDGIVQALQGKTADPRSFNYACDGAAVPKPGRLALNILGDPRLNAEVLTVSKAQIGDAMNLLWQYHDLPEPAGAEAMALALQLASAEAVGSSDVKRRIFIPVTTGTNTTPAKAAEFRRAAFEESSLAHLGRSVYGVAEVALHSQTGGTNRRFRALSSPARG